MNAQNSVLCIHVELCQVTTRRGHLIANLTYNAGGCEAHTVEPVVYDSIATAVDGSGTHKHKYTVL
jgi:hypothetical protein